MTAHEKEVGPPSPGAARRDARTERLAYVDGMRGLAALAVVQFHLNPFLAPTSVFGQMPQPWVGGVAWAGHLGVVVFFVISGFVMAQSTRRTPRGLTPAITVFVRRLVRLAPPYWAAIATNLVVHQSVSAMTGSTPPPVTAGQVLANALYLQRTLGYAHIDNAYWTLVLEVRFYLIFLAVRALAPSERLTYLALVASLIAGLGGPTGVYGADHMPGPDRLPAASVVGTWYSFCSGAVVFLSVATATRRRFAAGLMAAMIGAGGWLADPRLVTTGVCALALLYVDRLPYLRRGLEQPAVVSLGLISYSLYLFHWPIGRPVLAACSRFLPPSVAAGVFAYVAAVAAAVAAAWVMYRLVERPALALSRWLKGRVPTA